MESDYEPPGGVITSDSRLPPAGNPRVRRSRSKVVADRLSREVDGGFKIRAKRGAAAVADHADGLVVGSPLGPDLEAAVDLAAEAVGDHF